MKRKKVQERAYLVLNKRDRGGACVVHLHAHKTREAVTTINNTSSVHCGYIRRCGCILMCGYISM